MPLQQLMQTSISIQRALYQGRINKKTRGRLFAALLIISRSGLFTELVRRHNEAIHGICFIHVVTAGPYA
jgi:hypothetical protein